MAVKDKCFILQRFPVGDFSLLTKCYCKTVGRRDFLAVNYFKSKSIPIGLLEPFNIVEIHFMEKNGVLYLVDGRIPHNITGKVVKNLDRYFFLSKISNTILKFIKEPDKDIFELLTASLVIEDFFNFNLIRFWLNLATILGFSIENLNRPGWINLMTLKKCNPNEIYYPYCIYLSPKEFSLIKRIENSQTKPFTVSANLLNKLEKFFFKFLNHQTRQ